RCSTSMGSRWLRHALHHPSAHPDIAVARHAAVAELLGEGHYGIGSAIQQALKAVSDIERISSRIALKSARPRDLSALRDSLAALPSVQRLLQAAQAPLLTQLRDDIAIPVAALQLLQAAITAEPSAVLREGGVIADG